MDFSVLMTLYKNDNPYYFEQAFESIVNQTVVPTEILVVVDGPIGVDLDTSLDVIEKKYVDLISVIRLKENKGLGNACKIGVENAKYPLIARMDSDDISVPNRFEKQLDFLNQNHYVDIVGGQISEFIDEPTNIVGYRKVPLVDEDIKRQMKRRCAMNHVSVMFKKESILSVGNYQTLLYNEDYYLWIRMLKNNCVFANISDTLVNVRVGKEMYQRRGGKIYFESEKKIQDIMYNDGLIGWSEYICNILIRFLVQRVFTNKAREIFFNKFARTRREK